MKKVLLIAMLFGTTAAWAQEPQTDPEQTEVEQTETEAAEEENADPATRTRRNTSFQTWGEGPPIRC